MPDLKALNDIHAVHLTAVLCLSNSLHICNVYKTVYIRDKCKKKQRFRHKLTANNTTKTAKNYKKLITHQHIA